ncbi:hypothetical protein ACQ5SO_17250 [Rhodovulum sp. DZ06]|uniref:hypothetical protein n=1 Tax=Rhodovulum sp. DZ06 TaxID=3425126 RepID=UPI003D35164D
MNNPFKGEARLGDVRLKLDVNAVIEVEEETGEGINDVLARASEVGPGQLKAMRFVVWALMRHHRPEATLLHAGEVINAYGPEAVGMALGRVLAAQSDAAQSEAEGDAGNAPAPAPKPPAKKTARRKAG